MPAPDIGSDRVRAVEILGLGQQLPADDRGEMFKRDGDREVEFLGATLRQIEHRLNALVDALDIVTMVRNQPVERDMLARVVDFLRRKRLDLARQLGRQIFAENRATYR